ncbi:lipoprotein-releasing ABC transporter ATP-binding protein LolD [Helicobacter pylori]
MSNWVIDCQKVCKTYQDGGLNVDVLHDLTLQIQAGESVGIIGSSGSGKSTLLHLLGGLDEPSSGSITLMGQEIAKLSQAKLGQLRNQYLGFVYQFHHLLAEFTALENVMMPLLIGRMSAQNAKVQAALMLEKVGLGQRMMHRPAELSGGERQRAAIARALVKRPKCLLADEPTGNLDRRNACHVLDMMLELQAELDTALVVVTHDDELAQRFGRVLVMQDGSLHPQPTVQTRNES